MNHQAFGISLDDSRSPISVRHDLLEPSSMLCAGTDASSDARINRVPLAVSLLLGAGLVFGAGAAGGARAVCLLLLGTGLGVALFRSRFVFASAWRRLLTLNDPDGLRAHAILLIVATTAISFVAAHGLGAFGAVPDVTPFPLGIPLCLGALLFGVGMQFGSSCASGTLFATGAGQSTVLCTLAGFVSGTTVQAAMSGVTSHLWQTHGVLLSQHIGWAGSWFVTTAVLVGALVVLRVGRPADERRGRVRHRQRGAGVSLPLDLLRRPWPAPVGATVIGLLAGAVFLISGRPWGIILAFTEWGSRLLALAGLHPHHWYFWQQPATAGVLGNPLLANDQTLTDLGIIVGAAIAASVSGAWHLRSGASLRRKLQAVLGGVLMGVGARMSGGCNVGSYLGGISIGSASGWLWAAFALAGTSLGLQLRRRFGMAALDMTESVC